MTSTPSGPLDPKAKVQFYCENCSTMREVEISNGDIVCCDCALVIATFAPQNAFDSPALISEIEALRAAIAKADELISHMDMCAECGDTNSEKCPFANPILEEYRVLKNRGGQGEVGT